MKTLPCMADLWLFERLTPEERSHFQEFTRKYTYSKGEMLFMEGSPASAVFLVTEGRVKLFKVSNDGKEIILGFLAPHDLFGEDVLFADNARSMSAQAIEPTRVCACFKSDFERLLTQNPMVSMKVIQTLGEKLTHLTEQLADVAMYDVRERVARILTRLAKEYGEETSQGIRLNFRLTHDDLGALVGASRVMVTNVLHSLQEAGCVSNDGNRRFVVAPRLLSQTSMSMEVERTPPTPPCPCFERNVPQKSIITDSESRNLL